MKSHPLPWWPRDFEADEHVKLMTMEAEGVYRRLLDHQWLHGSIPDDPTQLAALCKRMPVPRFRALWLSVAPCFQPQEDYPGRLVNHRLERVRGEAEAYRAKRSAAGSKGMASRWQTDNTVITDRITNALPPTPTPTPTPEKKNNTHTQGDSPVPPELTPEAQDALTGMLRAAQNPDALLAEIRVILQGGRPNVPKDPALVSQALTDLRVAGQTRPTGKAIRAFVQGAKREREPPHAREPRTFGNGRAAPPPITYPASHETYRDPYADRQPGGLTTSLQDLLKKQGTVPS